MFLHCLCVPALMVALAADDATKDLAALQGTWTMVTAEDGGEKVSQERVAKIRVVIKESTITIQEEKASGTANERATFKLNSATTPKSMDMTSTRSENGVFKVAAKPCFAIYEMDGDSLKICWNNNPGGERPARFASEPKSNVTLFVLKRPNKP
jgi:uncharacterized protein (TIGR03067 family)